MAKNKEEAPAGLTPEQQKALEDEMRNNQAVAQRGKIAANYIPSIIRSYPNLTEEEMVDKATKLAELVMDKLLGVKFVPKDPAE